jgi:transcriptional regulator with XRE-family HTH domain
MAAMEKSIHTTDHKKLQRLLKQVRLGAGLRQEDLAELLGKPQSFVSKYEKGDRRLDLIELRQICEAVGISLTDFVKRFEDPVRK